jgi:hypothetical protein
MADLTITSTEVAPVQVFKAFTGPAAESVSAGQVVRLDTSTGKLTLANASSASEAGQQRGILLRSADPNETATAVEEGLVDVGDALSSLAYDAPVYLSDTDGTLADAAGTVTVLAGRVVPIFGNGTSTPDKLLAVDL